MVKAHTLALSAGLTCATAVTGTAVGDVLNLLPPGAPAMYTLLSVAAGTLIVLGVIGRVADRYGIPVNEALLHGYQLAREHQRTNDADDDGPDATVVALPTPRPDADSRGARHRHPSRRRAQL